METKKTAVDLTDLATGIMVLGLVATIGVIILVNLRDSRLTDLDVLTTNNETISTFGTNNQSNLANTWGVGVTTITNQSGYVVDSGNYTATVGSVDGVITVDNTTATQPLPWNVTYTYYDTTRADWALADDASIGINEYGSWFKIIVIMGIASLVLALIFMAFGNRGNSGATVY